MLRKIFAAMFAIVVVGSLVACETAFTTSSHITAPRTEINLMPWQRVVDEHGDSSVANPYASATDLDDDVTTWGVYTEISPTWIIANAITPSIDGKSLRCSITGGTPYSNLHCYRNLPPEPLSAKFALALSFWFSPTTTFNNQGAPSIVQALEFTMNKWQQGKRYEFALQWQNVGDGAPQWRYWNSSQWMSLGITGTLEGNQWHSLVLDGEITDGQTYYRGFTVDQQMHLISMLAPPADVPGETDRLAIAIQLDGNFEEAPYDVFIDQVSFAWKPLAEVYLPAVIK
jgi:hypothetical protein